MLLFISLSLFLFFFLLVRLSKDPLGKYLFFLQLALSLSDSYTELPREETVPQLDTLSVPSCADNAAAFDSRGACHACFMC